MSNGPLPTPPEPGTVPPEIEQQVVAKGAEALEGLVDPEARAEAVRRVLSTLGVAIQFEKTEITTRQHRGPVPSPDVAAGYEKILPGSTERMFAMAERDQMAFIASNARKQWLEAGFNTLALLCGAAGLAGILWAIVYLADHGHDWVAGSVAAIGVSGIVGLFVNARMSKSEDKSQ